MNSLPSPHVSPTACLEVDSPEARALQWLPFAVRFKLDACGLRLSLGDWQRIPHAQRSALVRAPLTVGVGGFEGLALALGAAVDAARRTDAPCPAAGDLQVPQGKDAEHWLACATPFAHYVARKIATRQARHATA